MPERVFCKGIRQACEKHLWLRQRDGRVAQGLEIESHVTTLHPDGDGSISVRVTLTDGSAFDLQFEVNR